MRAIIAASLAGVALAAAWLAADASATTTAEQRAAGFVRTACLAAIKDPAGLERMAKDHDWTRLARRSTDQPGAMTVIGTWEASQDGQVYLVTVATSRTRNGSQNICSVMFQNSRLTRSGFFAALTDGWTLTPRFDVKDADLRDEMYSVANVWPNELVLQMSSTGDGTVMGITLLAAL